jgi:hypothetical protein
MYDVFVLALNLWCLRTGRIGVPPPLRCDQPSSESVHPLGTPHYPRAAETVVALFNF